MVPLTSSIPATKSVLALKNIFRQKGGDSDIGQVDHVANAQIDCHTTDDISLFPTPSALLQQFNHVNQGVAGCQGQVFACLCAVRADGHAHGRNKVAWGSPFGGSKIPWMRKAWPADVVACRFPHLQAETYYRSGA